MSVHCGIYEIRNKINNRSYIGQSQNIERRMDAHRYALRAGRHSNTHLQRAWDKYGENTFEFRILIECSVHNLDQMEIWYIMQKNTYKDGYNRTLGGEGVRDGIRMHSFSMSVEARKHMREGHADFSGDNHPQRKEIVLLNTGEVFTCIKYAAEKYGVQHCDISHNAKGKLRSAGQLNGERLVWAYKPDYDNMTKDDIAELLHMAENWRRGRNCYKARRVICVTTGELFDTEKDAAETYGISCSVISAACNGRQRSAGKDKVTGKPLEWRFATTQNDALPLANSHRRQTDIS